MSDLKITAPVGSKLHEFLYGHKWRAEYARKCVPILVRWIEEENASHATTFREHSYQDLAIALGNAKIARPIPHALGLLGSTLEELQEKHSDTFGRKIPPLELLVWRKGAGRPGDSGFSWIGIKKSSLESYPEAALQSIAAQVRQKIVTYPHWRKVLKALNLKPLTINLPATKDVLSDPGFCGHGGKESPGHWRLKHYIAVNYSRLGLKGKHVATVEKALLSGDEVDVLLENASGSKVVGVEVKSRISSEADLIRGVFQGVKYRAVLSASEDYEVSRASTWLPRAVDVVLVTELPLTANVAALAKRFGIPHIVVKVPADYVAPARA